jgi:hypothetical protein
MTPKSKVYALGSMLLQAVSNKLYALSFVCWLTESILIALKSILVHLLHPISNLASSI